MSENPFSSNASEWLELQKKYWDAWSELSQQAFRGVPEHLPVDAWTDALEQWWKTVSPDAPSEVEDFYTRLIDQGRAFFRLSDSLGKALRSALPGGQSLLQAQQGIENALAGIREAFSTSGSNTPTAMRQVMAFWEMPLDSWQRTVSSMSLLPGDFLQAVRADELGRLTPDLHGSIDSLLSVPGVGYTREWQEQLQAYSRLCLDYQKAYQEYVAAYAKIGTRAVERLERKLLELLKAGEGITTLRELYDLWVDCCEGAYGEYVATDEYAELHARLVNGLMTVKRHGRMMVDELLGAMSMPTEREINTLQHRLQETRREGKALRAELEALKEHVDQFMGGGEVGVQGAAQLIARQTKTGPTPKVTPTPRQTRRKKSKATRGAGQKSAREKTKGG